MNDFMMLLCYTVEGGFWHFIGCWMVMWLCVVVCLGTVHAVLKVFLIPALYVNKCNCKKRGKGGCNEH